MIVPILLVIFILLALFIGGDRTAKSLITLSVNAAILFFAVIIMEAGANALIVSVITCLLVTLMTVFYQNEVNEKTKSAFWAVLIIFGIMLILIWIFVYGAHLQGIPTTVQYQIREENGYAGNIRISMFLVQMATILITLVGAVIDTAIAVASGTFEVVKNNPGMGKNELFYSGLKIGGGILSATVNTLFFIFAGEFLVTAVNFAAYRTFSVMVNSKEFAQGTITILISAVGCVLIIPITAMIAAGRFKRERRI